MLIAFLAAVVAGLGGVATGLGAVAATVLSTLVSLSA